LKRIGKTDEYFEILEINDSNRDLIDNNADGVLSILWFKKIIIL